MAKHDASMTPDKPIPRLNCPGGKRKTIANIGMQRKMRLDILLKTAAVSATPPSAAQTIARVEADSRRDRDTAHNAPATNGAERESANVRRSKKKVSGRNV